MVKSDKHDSTSGHGPASDKPGAKPGPAGPGKKPASGGRGDPKAPDHHPHRDWGTSGPTLAAPKAED